MTGIGIKKWPNGNIYTGDFVDDNRSGKGIYVWASGTKYDGDWENDKE